MNFRVGYAKYVQGGDVERASIVVATPGPTTPLISDLPYVRLERPVWFPDRHDGVTFPLIRRFGSPQCSSTVSTAHVAVAAEAKL
jgi:hypothetical protein